MTTTLRNRIGRLSDRLQLRNPDDCDGPPTAVVCHGQPMPDNPRPCPRCGTPHVLVIVERIVGTESEEGGPCEV